MQWVPVVSTVISQIGYDSAKRELAIEYRGSGDIYIYFDVPPAEHEEFMAAESKGIYLNTVFKLKEYRYTIVKRAQDPAT